MTTYYQYDPVYLNWVGITTDESSGISTTTQPVSVGAGLTQTWGGSAWSTTTDYSGTYYYTSGDDIGDAIAWSSPVEPPSLTTTTTPPSISTAGYTYSWSGTAWSVVPKATLPEGDEVMSLGASGNAYKDLFVSEGTVYLGVHTLSVASNKLEYDGEQVVTGVGGTFETDFAHLAQAEIGLATVTTLKDDGRGQIDLDSNLLPTQNRTYDLGHSQKSWNKVYVKSGPKAIEFEDTGIGIGISFGRLLFNGFRVFTGGGSIGTASNLENVYATGIVSATSFVGSGLSLTDVPAASGQAELIFANVRNTSGSSIDAGTPVYITAYNSGADRYEIATADAGSSATMPAAGLLRTTLANNANGEIVVQGQATLLDTSDYSEGDELWVHVGAGLTSVRPTGASERVQKIGQVLRSNGSTGVILVKGAGRTNDTPNTISIGNSITAGSLYSNSIVSSANLTVSGLSTFSSPIETNSGIIRPANSGVSLRINANDNTKFIQAIQAAGTAGGVELYHTNSKKLETTSTGINVTGIVTASSLSTGNEAMTFDVVGTDLIISVAGIGSTTLALG